MRHTYGGWIVLLLLSGLLASCGARGSVTVAGSSGETGGDTTVVIACGARIAAVDAFDGELAPVAHAAAGPDRARAACEHASSLQGRATAIADIQVASACAERWERATRTLLRRSSGLVQACAASSASIERKLERVHTAFHTVQEIAGGTVSDDGPGRGDPHADGERGDPHQDGERGDPHQDGERGDPHTDAQRGDPHTDAQRGDPHADGERGDPHADGEHGDPHTDSPRADPQPPPPATTRGRSDDRGSRDADAGPPRRGGGRD